MDKTFPDINALTLTQVVEALSLALANDPRALKPEARAEYDARVAALWDRRRRLIATERRNRRLP